MYLHEAVKILKNNNSAKYIHRESFPNHYYYFKDGTLRQHYRGTKESLPYLTEYDFTEKDWIVVYKKTDTYESADKESFLDKCNGFIKGPFFEGKPVKLDGPSITVTCHISDPYDGKYSSKIEGNGAAYSDQHWLKLYSEYQLNQLYNSRISGSYVYVKYLDGKTKPIKIAILEFFRNPETNYYHIDEIANPKERAEVSKEEFYFIKDILKYINNKEK